MRSGSTSSRVPRPVQVGHAPWGVLNEKLRGSSAGNEVPSYGQANASEYSRSAHTPADRSLMMTWPEPSRSACSTESAMRGLVFRLTRDHQAIDDDGDRVLLLLLELDLVAQVSNLAVDADAHEASLAHVVED